MITIRGKSILLFIIILFIFSVNALEIPTYQKDSVVDIKEDCHFENGGLCSSSAVCNITIRDSRGNPLVNNIRMTQHPSTAYFNYTLNESQTTNVGFFEQCIVCTDGTFTDFSCENFMITEGGYNLSIAQTLMYAFILLLLIGLFILLVFGYIRSKKKSKEFVELGLVGLGGIDYGKYIRLLLFFACYFVLFALFYASWQITEVLTLINFLSTIFQVGFILMGIILPFLIVALFWIMLVGVMRDRKLDALINRGVMPR